MTYAKAILICKRIEEYEQSDVLCAVEKILSMETINAVTKDELINIVRWFWDKCVDKEPEEGREDG